MKAHFHTPEILENIETVLNIGISLSAEKDHNRLLEMILTESRRITNADAGTLYLREEDILLFKIIQNETLGIFQGGRGEPVNLPPVPMHKENVASYAAITRQAVNIPDVYEAEGFDFSGPKKYDALTGYKTTSMLVIPLENHEGIVIGVLQLLNARDGDGKVIPFNKHFERIISSLASQAAIALTNTQLLAEIENLFNSFVQVMATAIDARTPYNANHTRRVALLAEEMAKAINKVEEGPWANVIFNKSRTAQLIMAAWMHDIGKVATPLEVMDKATRLGKRAEIVLLRFDYIISRIREQYLERKLALVENAQNGALAELEQWFEEQKKKIEYARELVIKTNDPSTFVSDELSAQLKTISEHTYIDENGKDQPWLTPDCVETLSVPRGTLTKAERLIMEEHVEVTRRILEKIPFTTKLKDVPTYAVLHHEHLDGKGYPKGLTGEQIAPEGRILALIDIFDALTASDRPYKKAMTVEEALKVMGYMVKDGKLDDELYKIFCDRQVWKCLL